MFPFFKKNSFRLFNSKTKHQEKFKPQKGKSVSIYSCGPTVYNYAHLGNLRSYLFADILKRSLEYTGYKVKHVINITDVGHLVSDADDGDDRMEKAIQREHKSAEEISNFYTKEFFHDLEKLNIQTKDVEFPKATEYISEQIALIQKLEKKGYTYKTSDGIYFNTSKFPKYGELGGIDLENLQEGARIGINKEKKNPTDFALWKFSKENRQQEWDSPWGVGFPGWHIECSAMSMKLLGDTIDIHTGGIDHIPVHHNNEIAQSESVTGKEFVRFWMHNQFLNVESGKMAKSAENFLRLESVIEKNIHPLSYRYFLLQAHYRSPLTFSWQSLDASETALRRLSENYQKLPDGGKISKRYKKEFEERLQDDLDTPGALAILWKLLKDDSIPPKDKKATIKDFDQVLGLKIDKISFEQEVPGEIKDLAQEREDAREKKDFKKADSIRFKLKEKGFEIRDTEDGTEIQKT